MHFDDGSDPWVETENMIQIFNFGYFSSSGTVFASQLVLYCTLLLAYVHLY